MKKLQIPLLLVAGLFGSIVSLRAQTPPPPPPPPGAIAAATAETPPPPPPGDPMDKRGRGPARPVPPPDGQGLAPVTAYQGTVRQLTTNGDEVYDGFSMNQGSDSLRVKFDPALGAQMMKLIKPGANITVNGAIRTTPDGTRDLRLVSVTAGGQTIMNQRSADTNPLPAPTPVTGKGKVSGMQTGPDARITGIILDNQKILRLPPAAIGGLGQQIQIGTSLSYTGEIRPRRSGEVSASGNQLVDIQTITVNGQQYLVR